jgi:hypothetical protein
MERGRVDREIQVGDRLFTTGLVLRMAAAAEANDAVILRSPDAAICFLAAR